ncbi:MAG: endonuclease [Candidatus Delongbacteria bacterium]
MRRLILSLSLLLLTFPARAAQVFISEYIEGSSYNKALEIYNGSGAALNLADYRFALASNGGATPTYYTFSGTLAAGEVFVVSHASAAAGILALADVTSSGFANWNGDDFVGLYQVIAGNNVLIDAIGVLGTDPGSAWAVAGVTDGTVNHTLVRKSTVSQGNTIWSASAGSDAAGSEWIVSAVDTWDDLGSHSTGGNTPPVIADLSRTPANPAAGQSVTISANLSDDGSVASADLRYQLNGGSWIVTPLSAGAPPSWSGQIPGQAGGVTVGYQITAVDELGLSSSSALASYTLPVQSPPVISELAHSPLVPTHSQTVTVSAQITDDGVVVAATLHYTVDAGSPQALSLSAGPPALWSAVLPAQPDGAVVEFQLEAVDDEGLMAASAPVSYTVDDAPPAPQVTAPVFTEGSLALGTVLTTATGTAYAHLSNPGSVPVWVETLSCLGLPFSCAPASVLIGPGQTVTVTVSVQPPHNLQYTGWLVAEGDWGATALPLSAAGDYPGSTWDSTFNLSGSALKVELNDLVSGHTALSYDAARLEMFSDLDNVNGWVECVYTGLDVQTTGIPDNAVMNTEHTWPQSYGAEGVARSDLHHLFPTDSWINSSRGNLPFGEVLVSSSGYPIGGADRGTNATGQTVFEPRDLHKGDCARAVMYFALRYGNLSDFLGMAGQESVLRAWHQSDPVSNKEIMRNQDIEVLQHNRNPFIEQPGLLLRLNSLAGGADLPPTPAEFRAFPDTLEVACAGSPLTVQLWLGNPGGSPLSLSSLSSSDPACISVGTWPASLAPGAGALVPVTLSGPCDGQSALTLVSSAGTRSIPLFWSWASATPLAAPVVSISRVGASHLLDWEDVPGALSYRVETAPALDGPWSPLSTVVESQLLEGEGWPATSLFRVISQ